MNFSGRHLPPVQAKPVPKFKAPLPGLFPSLFPLVEVNRARWSLTDERAAAQRHDDSVVDLKPDCFATMTRPEKA